MNLKDKVVVITGGSKGFGKALAIGFVNEGAKVVINSNNEKEIQDTAQEIGAVGVCADVTKEEDLINLANEVIEKFGGFDIWVNNAGLWMPKKLIEDMDMDMVKKVFDVNVIGTINGMRVALRFMKEKKSGTIINVISDSALKQPKISASVYSASKWAVNGLAKIIREEDKNISILSIYPGAMKTDLFRGNIPDNFNDFMEVEDVVKDVIGNLKSENPQEELLIEKQYN